MHVRMFGVEWHWIVEKVYTDRLSGKNTDRPELQKIDKLDGIDKFIALGYGSVADGKGCWAVPYFYRF